VYIVYLKKFKVKLCVTVLCLIHYQQHMYFSGGLKELSWEQSCPSSILVFTVFTLHMFSPFLQNFLSVHSAVLKHTTTLPFHLSESSNRRSMPVICPSLDTILSPSNPHKVSFRPVFILPSQLLLGFPKYFTFLLHPSYIIKLI
jgi:hypothetical protein